jgi:hypothetical protein
VSVLVNDDTSLKSAVSERIGIVPHVHPHACSLAIRWGSKVGVVESAAILCVEENKVITNTTLSVVVDLEVSCLLVEAERVQQVVINVGSVEQLGDRSVRVALEIRLIGGVGVMELEVRADRSWQIVVFACSLVCPVVLCNAVVAACGGVLLAAITVPTEFTRLSVKRISDDNALAFCWVVDSPGATTGQRMICQPKFSYSLDLVRCICGVINDGVHLTAINGIDVRQEPVAHDVGLDSPGQRELALRCLNIDKARLWL